MGYVTAFAAEEAKVAVHSLLSLLLSQLAVLSKFGREVRLVAVGRAGGWSSRVVVVVGAEVAFVRAGVVFPVVQLAVGLHRFVRFVGFTGIGGVFMADFGVTFPVAGIDRLDEGGASVEIVWFCR